jgi:hypothetical protein
MPDLARLWQHIHTTRAQTRDLRRRAQQTCWRAAQTRQAAAMTCQRAMIVQLRRSMPGATALTCAITAAILAQRGLLDHRPAARPTPPLSPRGLGRADGDDG